jgi:DNA-directed RNA polymerase subunit K/omega
MSVENQPISEETSFEELQKEFSFDLPPTVETPSTPKDLPEINLDIDIKEEVEEKKVEEQKPKVDSSTEYSKIVKKFLDNGDWDDAVIKTDDGEIKISELENISEEEFYNLIADQKALKEDDVKDKYLPVDGLAEDRKLIIDIVAKGGDLKDIFQSPEQMQKPYDESLGWDLDNEQHQFKIVEDYYIATGIEAKRAKQLAMADMNDMELDIKAKHIVQGYQEAYSNNLKQIAKNLDDENKAEQERVKAYRSDLIKSYKEQNIPESLSKKLVDVATKENQDGVLAIDGIYEKLMEDPKEAKEIIFFLMERDKYLQEKMKETKVQTQMQNMRVINRIPKSSDKKNNTEDNTETKTGFTFELPK